MKHIYPVLSDLEDVYRSTSSSGNRLRSRPDLSPPPGNPQPLFRFIRDRGLAKVATLSIGCLRIVVANLTGLIGIPLFLSLEREDDVWVDR